MSMWHITFLEILIELDTSASSSQVISWLAAYSWRSERVNAGLPQNDVRSDPRLKSHALAFKALQCTVQPHTGPLLWYQTGM